MLYVVKLMITMRLKEVCLQIWKIPARNFLLILCCVSRACESLQDVVEISLQSKFIEEVFIFWIPNEVRLLFRKCFLKCEATLK